MSDEKLIRLAAKAMGWTAHHRNTAHWTDANTAKSCDYVVRANVNEWNPLASDTDAFQLVDAIKSRGVLLKLTEFSVGAQAEFRKESGYVSGYTSPERKRAIVIASIMATTEGK
jgi:hypothetical protein